MITMRLGANGEPEPGGEAMLVSELAAAGASDLMVFCHGWNAPGESVSRSARAFLHAMPALLKRHADPGRRVALLDVQWPGRRWTDEPVPARDPVAVLDSGTAPEPAGASGPGDERDHLLVSAPPPPDEVSQRITRGAFPVVQRDQIPTSCSTCWWPGRTIGWP